VSVPILTDKGKDW